MKERTFYTINLDIRRIVFIILVLIGLMTYFFMLGNAMGKKSVAAKDSPKETSETTRHEENKVSEKSLLKSSPEENMVPAPAEDKVGGKESEVVDLKPSTDATKAIPVPVSPVQEVKEDLTKKPIAVNPVQPPPGKTAQPGPVPVNPVTPVLPAKKAPYPFPAKKAIAPPAKTPIVLEEKNFYTIQLGAFSSQEQANKFKDNVVTKNKFPGKFAPYVLKQRDFFVVLVGKSTAKEELEKIVQNLDAATQGSAMIVKSKKP